MRLSLSYDQVEVKQEFSLPYQRLQEWALIGPFQVMPGLPTDFISYPKRPIDCSRPCPRRSGGTVEWQTVPMQDEIDFAYFFGKYADERLGPLVGPNFAAAFAHTHFLSTGTQRAKLEVQSENRCAVWVNRKQVFPTGTGAAEDGAEATLLTGDEDEDEDLEFEEDEEEGFVLRKGWNEVCVKCLKETEKSWKAKLVFVPAKPGDRDFAPPQVFAIRPETDD